MPLGQTYLCICFPEMAIQENNKNEKSFWLTLNLQLAMTLSKQFIRQAQWVRLSILPISLQKKPNFLKNVVPVCVNFQISLKALSIFLAGHPEAFCLFCMLAFI